MIKTIGRWTSRIFLSLLGVILLVIMLLYIPPIQNMVVKAVLAKVNANPEMQVTVDRFRLSPPLRVSLSGATVVQRGDTIADIGSARVSVSLLPLLKGEVKISGVAIESTAVNIGNPDSAMYLRARLSEASIEDARIKLSSKDVRIKDIILATVDADMKLRPDTTPPDTTPSSPQPWKIDVDDFYASALTYRMAIEGSIDSLGVTLPLGNIKRLHLDMPCKQADVALATFDGLSAAFLKPAESDLSDQSDLSDLSDMSDATVDSVATQPWAIAVGKVELTATDALYGTAGADPQEGLDMNYLQLADVAIRVDSLLSRGSELKAVIRDVAAYERCGLDVKLSGRFAMDSDSISLKDFILSTPRTRLEADAAMGMGGGSFPSPLVVKAEGYVSPADVRMAMPSMRPLLAGIPKGDVLDVDIDIDGEDNVCDVNALSFELPGCFTLGATGSVANPPSIDAMKGRLKLKGRVYSGRFLEPALDGGVAVPPMVMDGDMIFSGGLITGKLDATTRSGRLALDADWRARRESYDLTLKADSFPVDAFMPALEVKKLSADIDVKGQGYDFRSARTAIAARADIAEVTYLTHTYRDLSLRADIADGEATVKASSPDPAARIDLTAKGNLAGESYDWSVAADVASLDLQRLGLTDSVMHGSTSLSGTIAYTPAVRRKSGSSIAGRLDVASLDWSMNSDHFATTDFNLDFSTTDSVTVADIDNHDLHASLTLPMPMDSIMARLAATTTLLDTCMSRRALDVVALQKAMPPMAMTLTAGTNNLVDSYMENMDMEFTRARFDLTNDSLINFGGRILNFTKGSTVIDTLDIAGHQAADKLLFDLHIGNRPGTLDEWASVTATGEIDARHASVMLDQRNIKGLTGYHLGFLAKFFGDDLAIHVIPKDPVIGYKNWVVNDSNFVALNFGEKHLDANLLMKSAESSIHLYTDHTAGNDSIQEDVILDVKDIKLAEWIAVNPFAPPVAGTLSADMRFGWDDASIGGSGLVSLADLTYGRERVGSFDLGLDLSTNTQGTIRAEATLIVDSIKTITAEGVLNDSTARNPFLLDFKMIHFPLTVLNPFLPADKARLAGTLNGTMDITGSLGEPIFNGYLDFDNTTLRVPMMGTTYSFSDTKIPMDSNVVNINNFAITGGNDKPLYISGTVDARRLHDIRIDLDAKASGMQAVKSKKGKDVSITGNAFINLNADIHGSLSRLDIDADLSLLPPTDVTYLMASASTAGGSLSSRSTSDVVRFVNFADTVAVAAVDTVTSTGMLMKIDAILRLQEGTIINIDMSANGKDRIQLQPAGTLDYTSNYMGDSRLTGRLNLNDGFVRYSPPLMSEKNFKLEQGSYVAFSGDMLNPYINIKAVDVMRANVEQDGQNSRLINFDVILNITNTLNDIDVAFDLATKDDITVANELQSMTPEQRANQAMNLLLYNVYTGPGTKASASLSGNPLYSFLEGQVNSWAAEHVKGVDLSFGIDQYDRTVDGASSTATSYSYKMSKSLFDNRFKISVGGNYATEDDADQNLSQNLINDISFEYYITPSGSMYVKIFRHTGFESILEGEVTQTGVGFVYKRKLRKLRDLFLPLNYFRRRSKDAAPTPAATTPENTTR